MKKIFLIVAVLMLATPALAVDVDVWAEQGDDVNKVEIWYEVYNPVPADCNDGNRPRAFGLNITVTDGNIIDINVPFEGECDDVNRGYGIFPGTISIVDGEVTGWGGPIAPDDAPGAEDTGLDTNTIVVEMGSLYTDNNCPDPCAMLFYIVVNMDCDVSIEGNAARTGTASPEGKGVVLENLAAVTVNWPESFPVRQVSRWVPDVVGTPYQPDACEAIDACDLVVGDVVYVCDLTYSAGEVTMQMPEGMTEVEQGREIDLWVSLGDCDFGDANDPPYPTLLASNGARHIATGVKLGALRDTEVDGQPNATATGDDIAVSDDEDGVTFGLVIIPGGTANVTVDAACYLNAWVDFTDDGDWDDAGEQIFTNQFIVGAGTYGIGFAVPAGAVRETDLISRWRVTSYIPDPNIYDGLETDGEVEDHNVMVVCHVPDVVNEPNLAARQWLIDAGFTIGNVTAECNDLIPDGNVISTNPPYCTVDICGSAVDIVVSSGPCAVEECFPSDHPDYAMWLQVGEPPCWCPDANGGSDYQCKGDADGIFSGFDKDGKRKYVVLADLKILRSGWQLYDNDPNFSTFICADFDHDFTGFDKDGKRKHVTLDDLKILRVHWQLYDNDPCMITPPCFP